MGNTPPEYWGYLVKADKSPSIIFELLLCGIANYINRQIAPWDVNCLTPTKLAAFYRVVGGNYDPLFLETPKASLSFIYQSMGCFHTLQPEKDPYLAPSIPALTIQGFVRWQTVQLLLEPDQHASFLQNAVKRLEIINPADGIPFPDRLPRHALPSRPDPEMIQWHGGVAENLRLESHPSDSRDLPPGLLIQRGDIPNERPSASCYERRSVNGTIGYITHPREQPPFRPPPSIKVPRSIDAPPIGNPSELHPWDLERRWSSTSDLRLPNTSRLPGEGSASNVNLPQNHFDRSHPRSPSTRYHQKIFRSFGQYNNQHHVQGEYGPSPDEDYLSKQAHFSTPLNITSGSIRFNVPNTATTITFANWAKLLYQTDISLCLLEGMSDLATLAIRNKGDGRITGNRFRKSYGKATVSMESYSPPSFALTTGVLVDTLRGIGLFMSLYGYYEMDFDIYNKHLGHVGIGIVQY
ncbi:MAG: hypothetical protein Q9209_007926 [Squamulea sp. 1 TL-2023]